MLLVLQHIGGRWCAPSMQDGEITEEAAAKWADAVCETLGLSAGSLVPHIVADDADPRIGELIAEPPAPEPAPAPPTPNPNGFLLAAMGALGLVPGNALLAKWPTFTVALNASNWGVSRQVLGAALQAGDLTQEQYTTLTSLLSDHGIPEV